MSVFPFPSSLTPKTKSKGEVVPIINENFDYDKALSDLTNQIDENFVKECIEKNKNYDNLTPKERYEYIDSCGATKQYQKENEKSDAENLKERQAKRTGSENLKRTGSEESKVSDASLFNFLKSNAVPVIPTGGKRRSRKNKKSRKSKKNNKKSRKSRR